MLPNTLTDARRACVEEEIIRMEEAKALTEDRKARMEKDLAHLEKDIHEQTMLLSGLRSKKNSLSLASRLPHETLETIFIQCARDFYESDIGGNFAYSAPAWVNISYVCAHWRNVALNCPTLWSYHFNTSLHWTEELLERSKHVLLKVSCTCPHPRQWREFRDHTHLMLRLIQNLLEHSEHIQDLHLRRVPHFLNQLPLCALHLETLEIEGLFEVSTPEWDTAFTGTVGNNGPLRTLKLVNCSLRWYSLNLSGLETLSLCRVGSPSPIYMAEFLDILSGMPQLSILHLELVLLSARNHLTGDNTLVPPKINLLRLTTLSVTAPLSAVAVLLSRINIPSETRLSLQPQFEGSSSIGNYAAISAFLAQQFSNPSSPAPILHSLVLDAGPVPSFTFSSLVRNCDPSSPEGEAGCYVPLQITLRHSQEQEETEENDLSWENSDEFELPLTERQRQGILSDICCSLPLSNVQSLHLTQLPQSSSTLWETLFRRLDGLQSLKLSHGLIPDLSDVLALVAHEPRENSSGQSSQDQGSISNHVFVPALKELVLDHILFKPESPAWWRFSMTEQSFFDALSARKELQARLIMTDCGVIDLH